jgi:Fe-S-cluster containining protein
MIERAENLHGRRIASGERFRFRCAPDLECFNTCCRNKRLVLYPYDLLRLRRGLGLPSQQVLEEHVLLELDPDSGWPAPRIALRDDGRCPFVGEGGCGVYAHRPTCCRIFPLARALSPKAGGGHEEFYFADEGAKCLGWRQDRELTLEQWIEEQGLAPYHEANNNAAHFFMHPRRQRPLALSERQLHGVLMALYNLDIFRQAASQEGFAERFELSPGRMEAALGDDEGLLALGQDWITAQLFGPE